MRLDGIIFFSVDDTFHHATRPVHLRHRSFIVEASILNSNMLGSVISWLHLQILFRGIFFINCIFSKKR